MNDIDYIKIFRDLAQRYAHFLEEENVEDSKIYNYIKNYGETIYDEYAPDFNVTLPIAYEDFLKDFAEVFPKQVYTLQWLKKVLLREEEEVSEKEYSLFCFDGYLDFLTFDTQCGFDDYNTSDHVVDTFYGGLKDAENLWAEEEDTVKIICLNCSEEDEENTYFTPVAFSVENSEWKDWSEFDSDNLPWEEEEESFDYGVDWDDPDQLYVGPGNPERGSLEESSSLDKKFTTECGPLRENLEDEMMPGETLRDLVEYYSSSKKSEMDIWNEVYNAYKDEDLADAVLRALEEDPGKSLEGLDWDQAFNDIAEYYADTFVDDDDKENDRVYNYIKNYVYTSGESNYTYQYFLDDFCFDFPELAETASWLEDVGDESGLLPYPHNEHDGYNVPFELHYKENKDKKTNIASFTPSRFTSSDYRITAKLTQKPEKKNLNESTHDELSVSHTKYVLDNVLNWDRGENLDKRSLKQIARACAEYDDNFSAEEYAKVIKEKELLFKNTKNSIYRTKESHKIREAWTDDQKLEAEAILDDLEPAWEAFVGNETELNTDKYRNEVYFYNKVSLDRQLFSASLRVLDVETDTPRAFASISSIHPYDDAEYSWAYCEDFLRDPETWNISRYRRAARGSKTLTQLTGVTSIQELLERMSELDKDVEPIMVHM